MAIRAPAEHGDQKAYYQSEMYNAIHLQSVSQKIRYKMTAGQGCMDQHSPPLSLSALPSTNRLEADMAAAASIGESTVPLIGYSTPG